MCEGERILHFSGWRVSAIISPCVFCSRASRRDVSEHPLPTAAKALSLKTCPEAQTLKMLKSSGFSCLPSHSCEGDAPSLPLLVQALKDCPTTQAEPKAENI